MKNLHCLLILLVFIFLVFSSCRKDPEIIESGPPCGTCQDSDTLMITSAEPQLICVYDSMGRIVSFDCATSAWAHNTNIDWNYTGGLLESRKQSGFQGVFDSITYTGNNGVISHWHEGLTPPPPFINYALVLDENGYALVYGKYGTSFPDSCTYHYNSMGVLDSVFYHTKKKVDKLFYNSSGLLNEAILYDSLGTVLRTDKYYYDDENHWVRYDNYVPGGITKTTHYYYNCCGQLIMSSDNWDSLDYHQTGLGEIMNLNPINFYRYPHFLLRRLF